MRVMQRWKMPLLLLWLALAANCTTLHPPPAGESQRLIGRPDFTPAAQAAPDWVRDALRTINRLEFELEGKP
jgi:hypothetical protein